MSDPNPPAPATITNSDSSDRPDLFPKLTAADIDCLCPFAVEVRLGEGEKLFGENEPENEFYIILEGRLKITRALGRGTAEDEVVLTVHGPGDFTGALSFLTGELSIASGIALAPTTVLKIDRDGFARALIVCAPTVRGILTAMAARRPEADAFVFQREKLAALGKMAAGLAHELNNPAAAAARALSELPTLLQTWEERTLAVGRFVDAEAGAALVEKVRDAAARAQNAPALSPLERGDREDEIAVWLEAHGASDPYTDASTLSEAGLTVADLGEIADSVPTDALPDVLCWLEARIAVEARVADGGQSVVRLSETVKAVKAYTFMDQGARQSVDVRAGLDSTVAMLGHQLREKRITVVRDFAPDLPTIDGSGGELNQVWTNLIDNAAAVVPTDGTGRISLTAQAEADGHVLVAVEDNGPGVPPDVLPHLFEPFYTTKPQGEGTGLGLDTAYRIVTVRHHGTIRVVSASNGSGARFEVRLPLSTAGRQ